jgi:hypothetical protein
MGGGEQLADDNPQLPDGDVSPLVRSLRTSLRTFKLGADETSLLATNADPYNDDLPDSMAGNSTLPRKRLLIGVLSDPKSLRTLGMAACVHMYASFESFSSLSRG